MNGKQQDELTIVNGDDPTDMSGRDTYVPTEYSYHQVIEERPHQSVQQAKPQLNTCTYCSRAYSCNPPPNANTGQRRRDRFAHWLKSKFI